MGRKKEMQARTSEVSEQNMKEQRDKVERDKVNLTDRIRLTEITLNDKNIQIEKLTNEHRIDTQRVIHMEAETKLLEDRKKDLEIEIERLQVDLEATKKDSRKCFICLQC